MCPTTLEQQYPGTQVFQLIPVRIIFGGFFERISSSPSGFSFFFLFHFSEYRFVEVNCKS